MRANARRAALSACILALVSLSASCWMPSFDPALSVSTWMDAIFGDHGRAEWRKSYTIALAGDSDDGFSYFLPFRMPATPGGYVVTPGDGYMRIATILMGESAWETGKVWGDGNPLGKAAVVGPMPGSSETVFVYRDPLKGLESLVIYGGSVNPLLGSALTDPSDSRRLLALGTWSDPSIDPGGQTRFVEILMGESGDAYARRGSISTSSFTIDSDIEPALNDPIDQFPVTPTGPGFAAYDLATSTYFVSPNLPDPSLWRAQAPGAATASKIVDLKAPATGMVHDAVDKPVFLAAGRSYTDLYSGSGAYLGWLPTGSWRFAFEYWDTTDSTWISVFSRFMVLTDNKDDIGNLAFAQVEGVPTADLLAFAAEKLGN